MAACFCLLYRSIIPQPFVPFSVLADWGGSRAFCCGNCGCGGWGLPAVGPRGGVPGGVWLRCGACAGRGTTRRFWGGRPGAVCLASAFRRLAWACPRPGRGSPPQARAVPSGLLVLAMERMKRARGS